MSCLKRKKILFVSNIYPVAREKTSTNVTTAVRDLIEGAFSQGMNVIGVIRFESFLRKPVSGCNSFLENGIQVFDVPRVGFRDWIFPEVTKFLSRRELGSLEPDIVVSHRATNLYFAKSIFGSSPKYVFVLHQSDFSSKRLSYALSQSNIVLARSKPLSDRLLKVYPKTKVSGIVGSGVDMSTAKRKDRALVDSNTLKIVFAGRLVSLKNIDVVLAALSKLRAQDYCFSFKILGDGPLRENLEKIVLELGISDSVQFYGHVDKSTVLSVMSDSHLFVMPSAPETFGLAYLEAMSQGCAVIGHRGWGIDGLVEDGVQGYLVNEANDQNILDCFLRYLRLPGVQRFDLHEEAFNLAARNDKSSAAENYKSLIESVMYDV